MSAEQPFGFGPDEEIPYVRPEEYIGDGTFVYERRPPLPEPLWSSPLRRDETHEILGQFTDLPWQDGISGYLLAGWTVLAPMCGALDWRPHVWITGDSDFRYIALHKLVWPLLAGWGKMYAAGSTEAGIRQDMRADALPVVYEGVSAGTAGKRTERVILRLARVASSEGSETSLEARRSRVNFPIRSMFLVSSIDDAGLKSQSDRSHFCLLNLERELTIGVQRRREYLNRHGSASSAVDQEMGRRLMARMFNWIQTQRLDELIRSCRSAATAVLGERHLGNQYGTLLGGALALMHDEVPDEKEVMLWMKDLVAQ